MIGPAHRVKMPPIGASMGFRTTPASPEGPTRETRSMLYATRAMARYLSIIPALLAGLAACDRSGSEPETSTDGAAVTSPGGPPILTFASLSHDFGIMDETDQRSTTFEFTNTGGSELVISDVKATCGCTTITLTKRRYQPGETGRIEVGFDPVSPGPQDKVIVVLANVEPAVTRLRVLANVTAFVFVEPRILQLGVLQYGYEHRARLTVSSVDENFVVQSVTTTIPGVSARVVPPDAATAPGPKTIEVTIPPTVAWGGLYFGVQITVSGRVGAGTPTRTHTRTVRVAGRLFGVLSASPDMFRFAVDPGDRIERKIHLRRADGRPFRVLSSSVRIPALPDATVKVEPESLDTWAVTLSATARSVPGPCPGVVAITTDVRGEEVIELRSLGVVRTPQ